MFKESHPPQTTEDGIFSSENFIKGAEKLSFSYDDLPRMHEMGVFICKNSQQETPVAITPRTWALFDKNFETPRVVYQGSGLIVSMLMAEKEVSATTGHETGPIAFFDTNGDFHDSRTLKDVYEYTKRNGREMLRHRAVFEWQDENQQLQQEDVAIDDIYCLTAAAQ